MNFQRSLYLNVSELSTWKWNKSCFIFLIFKFTQSLWPLKLATFRRYDFHLILRSTLGLIGAQECLTVGTVMICIATRTATVWTACTRPAAGKIIKRELESWEKVTKILTKTSIGTEQSSVFWTLTYDRLWSW